jgi:hypothetical protein
MKQLLEILPYGWERKAKELGAMKRDSGTIRTAESLLRLNMLYLTNEGSFQQAALGMALTEGISISKVAAFKRIKNSGEWLRWMAKELLENEGMALPRPSFLGDRRAILIDASDEAVKGSRQSDYRLHYAFDLFRFQCKSIEVTNIKEGEKLGRYSINEDEIVIADRIYCTMSGIEHVLGQNGKFLLRFKSKAFNLYDADGQKLELLPLLRHLNTHENTDVYCFYRLSDGTLRPIRLVAMRKDAKAIEASKRKMIRKASKKQEKAAQADTIELNEYVILATNLEYTNAQVLELYRARWQVEQVFFRLKSLFGYGDTPNKRDDSVQAWFFGKLLLAALCESILKRMSFPPQLDSIIVGLVGAQCLE